MNPPKVMLDNLTPEQQRVVILLALEVVYDLGADKAFAAYEKVDFSNIEQDDVLYPAFWSLLNSEQRSIIRSLSELAHDK